MQFMKTLGFVALLFSSTKSICLKGETEDSSFPITFQSGAQGQGRDEDEAYRRCLEDFKARGKQWSQKYAPLCASECGTPVSVVQYHYSQEDTCATCQPMEDGSVKCSGGKVTATCSCRSN